MKRFSIILLAALLALCACSHPAKSIPDEPTAEETVRDALSALQDVDSVHMKEELRLAATLNDGEDNRVVLTMTLDADYAKSPMIMKGTLTLGMEESDGESSDELAVQFCWWEKDGKMTAAYSSDGSGQWWGSSAPMPGGDSKYVEYVDLLKDGILNLERAGEDTVGGVPVTLFNGVIDGEGIRKLVEAAQGDFAGDAPITFSDELTAELPPVALTFAIDENGMPVLFRAEATAFAQKLVERLIGPLIAQSGETLTVDLLTLDMTYSDFNAVGTVEPPANYTESSPMDFSSFLVG